jgi:branched-chain amino acid transport system permease protein
VSIRFPALIPGRIGAAFAVAVVVLAVLPLVFDFPPYERNLFTIAFLMVSGALAWNWLGGYLGQVSFGHAAMFAWAGSSRAPHAAQTRRPRHRVDRGRVAAGIFSLGAHPMLRLRGPYFSIATIGVGEASRLFFTYWEGFTGGSSGLSLPIEIGMKARLYWWALLLMAIVIAASFVIRRSTLGLQLLAIKADVDAAADVGVNATFYQDVMVVLSGTVVGVTGGLYASFFSFIEPSDMFGFDRSIAFVLMSVIGGVGTILGPVFGAIVFVLLRQFLLASYPQLYLGLYGILLILIILFEPLGLTGLALRLSRAVRRWRRRAAQGSLA